MGSSFFYFSSRPRSSGSEAMLDRTLYMINSLFQSIQLKTPPTQYENTSPISEVALFIKIGPIHSNNNDQIIR
jgi:hypothetical protein